MPSPAEIKEELLNKLKQLPDFDQLKFIYLYGSQAGGQVTERSDIDICLYYDLKDARQLHRLLYKISGSVSDAFDIQMFQFLSLTVKREVFKGQLLYNKDKEFVHQLARRTYRDYQDFKPRRDYILYGKAGVKGAKL